MTQFHKSSNCISCEVCNKKSPLFHLLSGAELDIINENRYEVKFKGGENILKQGTPSSHLVMITSGMAKLFIEGIDNKNLIIELVRPWKIFGVPGIYFDNRYHYSVTAIEPSTACFIDVSNFKKVVRTNPDFAEAFISLCSLNNIKFFDRFMSIAQKQMHGRIADVLLYLKDEVYNSLSFEIAITRQDIGELSGLSKDSAIRILKEFEHEGIIRMVGKKMEIQKEELLTEISQKG
jgi:CRP/FNR family transcriptional regulator, polysaccharide utilization system transcription regulator